jgi:hypothetical protein
LPAGLTGRKRPRYTATAESFVALGCHCSGTGADFHYNGLGVLLTRNGPPA